MTGHQKLTGHDRTTLLAYIAVCLGETWERLGNTHQAKALLVLATLTVTMYKYLFGSRSMMAMSAMFVFFEMRVSTVILQKKYCFRCLRACHA